MNAERVVPIAALAPGSRHPAAHRLRGLLGAHGASIRAARGGGPLFDWARRIQRASHLRQTGDHDRSGRARPGGGERMSLLRVTHLLTVIVTSSYLTLAVFAFGDAKRLLLPYATL